MATRVISFTMIARMRAIRCGACCFFCLSRETFKIAFFCAVYGMSRHAIPRWPYNGEYDEVLHAT